MPRKLLLPHRAVCPPFRAPRGPHEALAMNAARSGYRVFSANSTAACTELAKRITERLGAELGKSVVYQETNGETRVEIKESVRGQDIFIIQTIPRDVNTAVMELLIMAYALKTSCARNIIGVIPYFPYSKQSKMRKRGSIVCKLLASMLAKAGLTHIITMDLHQKEIQGFFSFPVDNLRASPFLIQYIQEEIPDYRNAVIVAKSPDAAKRAQSYAERLRLGLAVIHGEAQCTEQDMDDGRHSPPMVKNATVHPGLELPLMMAKEKPPITVVGDVGGRIAIIVDDIIDDVESFVAAAEILKERGAYKIFVMATHGLLSADCAPSHRGVLHRRGGSNQHGSSRGTEAAVPQDKDCGHQPDPLRSHPANPQRGVHGLSLPQHHRRLTRVGRVKVLRVVSREIP
uniref:Phosphoribosyl pyrophosphate synthetase associated protein 1 n=1 Tax=Anas platyrhynchos TaxID=8839 RepID=A0A8B9T591_ANAPL